MRINSVQVLRAFAALFVAAGHTMGGAKEIGSFNRPALLTGAGVDLFFAISGFIIVFSSEKMFGEARATGKFFYRRLSRIVPLYWIATTVTLGLLVVSAMHGKEFPSIASIISSYLFFPNADFKPVDGMPFPILSLGWSLNYEMLFYFIFAPFIFLAREKCVFTVMAILVVGVFLGLVISPTNVPLKFWTEPIILEFALGMGIALAFRRGLQLPAYVRLGMLIFTIVWLFIDMGGLMHLSQTPSDFRRVLGLGLPTAVLLAAAVLGPDPLPAVLERPAALLGDASYSLYLTHPFVLVACQHVWLKVVGPTYLWMMVVMNIIAVVLSSIAINKVIENPLLEMLRGRSRAQASART